jgi:DNA-binding HxlR family transcriptional regulator
MEKTEHDPLGLALELIGDRWTLLIVHRLLAGPGRFNELMGEVSGIAPNILTKRLRHLESSGIVIASAYSQKPLRLQYELTASGHDLALALENLRAWGSQRRGPGKHELRHVCGTVLETRPWCPHCQATAQPQEVMGVSRSSVAAKTKAVDWV